MQHNKKHPSLVHYASHKVLFAAEPTLAELKAELQALTAKVAQLGKRSHRMGWCGYQYGGVTICHRRQ